MEESSETRWRVELHSHTCASPDSRLTAKTIISANRKRCIDALAITDHNTMDGAFDLAERLPFAVILGEEIKSTEGDIIGLFLSESVPRDLSPAETVAAIKGQGGLVVVPHPFDRFRRSALGHFWTESIVEDVDILEVVNGRTICGSDNDAADEYARDRGLVRAVGSDSHLAVEIGRCWQSMRPWSNPSEFLVSLCEAELHADPAPAWVHIGSSIHSYAAKVEGQFRRLTGS